LTELRLRQGSGMDARTTGGFPRDIQSLMKIASPSIHSIACPRKVAVTTREFGMRTLRRRRRPTADATELHLGQSNIESACPARSVSPDLTMEQDLPRTFALIIDLPRLDRKTAKQLVNRAHAIRL
jgi:hypothetical protein